MARELCDAQGNDWDDVFAGPACIAQAIAVLAAIERDNVVVPRVLLERVDNWLEYVDLTGTGRRPTIKVVAQLERDCAAVSALLVASPFAEPEERKR